MDDDGIRVGVSAIEQAGSLERCHIKFSVCVFPMKRAILSGFCTVMLSLFGCFARGLDDNRLRLELFSVVRVVNLRTVAVYLG